MKARSFGMDVLRTVSIWSVMIGHVAYWFHLEHDGLFHRVVKPLLLGVEPFFVLGGFLAALTFHRMHQRGHESYRLQDVKSYWYRRWMRTLPNYYLFLVIYTIAFFAVRDDFSFDWRYLIFFQNLFWLAPNFFSISWSLSTQEWFYVLFPLVFYVLFRLRVRRPILLASAIFVGFSLAARAWFLLHGDYENLEGFLRRVAVLRMDSVVIGVWIGWLYFSRFDSKRITRAAFWTGFAGIVALAFLRPQEWFAGQALVQLTFYPLFSLMLALTMPTIYEMEETRWQGFNKVFEMTSKWSYSIYLCHVFFKDGLFLVAGRLGIADSIPAMAALAVFWCALVYFVAGNLYKRFEVPMMLRLKPTHRGSPASASQPQS